MNKYLKVLLVFISLICISILMPYQTSTNIYPEMNYIDNSISITDMLIGIISSIILITFTIILFVFGFKNKNKNKNSLV